MATVAEGFGNADGSDAFPRLLACLDFINGLGCFRAYKERSWRQLHPRPGGTYLDVACGTGFDIAQMAASWPESRFVGLDASGRFLTAARARAPGLGNIEYVQADATRLPFPDAAFDGVRIDRSLQHMPDPRPVIGEMARVVRPGGRIVLSEPDWGTFILANGDPASAGIARRWVTLFRNPHMGRELPERLAQAGLRVTDTDISALKLDQYSDAAAVYDLEGAIDRCVAEGSLTAEAARLWIERSKQASEAGTFVSLLCLFTSAGERA